MEEAVWCHKELIFVQDVSYRLLICFPKAISWLPMDNYIEANKVTYLVSNHVSGKQTPEEYALICQGVQNTPALV